MTGTGSGKKYTILTIAAAMVVIGGAATYAGQLGNGLWWLIEPQAEKWVVKTAGPEIEKALDPVRKASEANTKANVEQTKAINNQTAAFDRLFEELSKRRRADENCARFPGGICPAE